MSGFGAREAAASGVMAALVCVATMLIQIPIPATEGFFNVGDAMVMVASLTFGPVVGGLAGGVGSALADALGGWYTWVPFTLIIKGAEGIVAGLIAGGRRENTPRRILAAWVCGGLIMVSGYFIVQVFLYGLGAALVEGPFNLVQMTVAGVVGVPISLALKSRLRI